MPFSFLEFSIGSAVVLREQKTFEKFIQNFLFVSILLGINILLWVLIRFWYSFSQTITLCVAHSRSLYFYTHFIYVFIIIYFDSGIFVLSTQTYIKKPMNSGKNQQNLFLPIGVIKPNFMHDTNDEIKMRKQLCWIIKVLIFLLSHAIIMSFVSLSGCVCMCVFFPVSMLMFSHKFSQFRVFLVPKHFWNFCTSFKWWCYMDLDNRSK